MFWKGIKPPFIIVWMSMYYHKPFSMYTTDFKLKKKIWLNVNESVLNVNKDFREMGVVYDIISFTTKLAETIKEESGIYYQG